MLSALVPHAVRAASDYAAAATRGAVETLNPADFSIAADVDVQLRKNYSNRMARERSPARDVYDQIKVMSEFCVLCETTIVSELDHYLPKKHFPLLAVAPENLLPVCHRCNHKKAEYRPDHTQAALLNPYYDYFLDDPWLKASVVQETRTIDFAVSPPASWPVARTERLVAHFHELDLRRMFSTMAGTELPSVRGLFLGNPEADRARLLGSMANSTEQDFGINHWKSATLRALGASDWYLAHGYQHM